MLASGADLKLGAYEFYLLEDGTGPPYTYTPESLYSDEQAIQGIEDSRTANPNVLVWANDDFAGGAETKYFNDIIPDTYWKGKANPRVRGSVTSPPTSAQATVTLTATSPTEWYETKVGGKIWAGAGRDLYYSSDSGVTWAQWNSTALFGAGYSINGMCHDGDKPWVTASNGTTRSTVRIDSTTAKTTSVSDVTSAARSYGMALLEGKVYMWTGGALYEYAAQDSLPITHRDSATSVYAANKVYSPSTATPTTFNAGIVATDTSVVYFTASAGQTLVYEYKYNAATNVFIGRKIWEPGEGFTAQSIAYSMGTVYLLGDYGDQVALFSMSLVSRDPLYTSAVGMAYSSEVGATLTPRAVAASYGTSVILAADDGTTTFYFVYDAEIDSMSELDQRTIAADGTCYQLATVGKKRLSFCNTASTTGRINSWKQDFDTPAGGWNLTTAAHNLKYPYDEKVLFSIQIVQDPSIAAGTVSVEYQMDEDGTFIATDSVGATMITPAGQKYTTFQISSGIGAAVTRKFRILRLRLTGASGARLFSATALAYINSYQELWRIRLRVDEETAALNSRPADRQVDASTLRSYIQTLVNNRNVVEFRDGTISNVFSNTANTGYRSKDVVLEFPKNTTGITSYKHNGAWRHAVELVLRAVA